MVRIYRSMGVPVRALVAVVGLLWLFAVVSCSQQGPGVRQEEEPMPQKTIAEVLKDHTASLMSLPGVVGTAEGECAGKPCISVFIMKKTPDLLKLIPSTIERYPVEVQETGEIRARDSD